MNVQVTVSCGGKRKVITLPRVPRVGQYIILEDDSVAQVLSYEHTLKRRVAPFSVVLPRAS